MRTTALALVALAAVACSSAPSAVNAPAPEAPAGAPDALLAAQAELDAGRPRDALPILDELMQSRPDDPQVWLVRGRACLLAAQDDSVPQFYYEDAQTAFEKALALGAGVEARWGAARAARMNQRPQEALAQVRQALLETPQPTADELRIAVEASFDTYISQRQAEQDATELFGETERRLQALLDAAPEDPWALVQLANLYQWDGQNEAALEILGQVLDASPDDEALHQRLIGLMRATEGGDAVGAYYAGFLRKHPEHPLGAWFLAIELFERAVARLGAQEDASATFGESEQLFAACRAAKPEYEASCLGYEVMCRAGSGWSALAANDLDRAERAFLAMEELFGGGIEWQIEGRMASGVTGLQFVADRALRQGGTRFGTFEAGAAARAATIYQRLHELRPSDGDIANNCGFFHREWGVSTVFKAREYRHEAEQAVDPAVKDLNLALAEAASTRAREILTRCRDAYLDAASLVPGDVRVVNDAALILVYHFPSWVERAEELLLRAVEEGARQKDAAELDDEARDALLEAWGDAHQNLGVIYLIHKHDPAVAREWFQKAFDIGPRPRVGREWVSQVALKMCDRAAAGQRVDFDQLDARIDFVE